MTAKLTLRGLFWAVVTPALIYGWASALGYFIGLAGGV
jgi:hypothetical protein